MKLDLFENKYRQSNLLKIFLADIVCFFLVVIASIGFCYAYFSDAVDANGSATLAMLVIDYRNDSNVIANSIYAQVNGATATTLSGVKVCPGDKINIKGLAVNSNSDGSVASDIDVYLLAKLNVETKDAGGNTIDTETIWYNIGGATAVPLYIERGLFQIGASVLSKNGSQAINIPYTIEGERYNNNYATITMTLELHSHQKDHLSSAPDYDNYSSVTTDVKVNGNTTTTTYSKDCIYATHMIVGRKRDLWEDSDATVTGLTLDELEKDASDNTGNTYLINSCKDWMIMRATSTAANSYHEGKTFKLNSYLDFNKEGNFNKRVENFNGLLDGQGYTIVNWVYTQGVFGRIMGSGVVKNFGVDWLLIVNNAGTTSGLAASLQAGALMENCFILGASVYGDALIDMDLVANQQANFGGLVGIAYGDGSENEVTILRNCCAKLNISVEGYYVRLGGIVGLQYQKWSLVENCYFDGELTITNSTGQEYESTTFAGLIVGYNLHGRVKDCFGITTNQTARNTFIIASQNQNIINSMYIVNANVQNGTTATKVGQEQTDRTLTYSSFKSSGLMRDAFGWDTNVWGTDIYTGNNNLVVLRVFYNY